MFFKRKESEAFKWFKDNIESISISKDASGFVNIKILGVFIGGKQNDSSNSYVYLTDGFVENLSNREARIVRKMLEIKAMEKLRNDRDQEIKKKSEQFMRSIRSNQ